MLGYDLAQVRGNLTSVNLIFFNIKINGFNVTKWGTADPPTARAIFAAVTSRCLLRLGVFKLFENTNLKKLI